MDQRSDDIRNDIESTRASLDDKLEQLEHRAKETFDLKHQVQEHPFMMLGAAVLTGYVLGSLGGDSAPKQSYSSGLGNTHSSQTGGEQHQHQGGGFLSGFDDEINMLKAAALATVGGMFKDIVREVAPSIGRQMESMQQQRQLAGGGSSSTHAMGTGNGASSSENTYNSGLREPRRAGSTYPEPIVREEHH